jgi:hypothetical protein
MLQLQSYAPLRQQVQALKADSQRVGITPKQIVGNLFLPLLFIMGGCTEAKVTRTFEQTCKNSQGDIVKITTSDKNEFDRFISEYCQSTNSKQNKSTHRPAEESSCPLFMRVGEEPCKFEKPGN